MDSPSKLPLRHFERVVHGCQNGDDKRWLLKCTKAAGNQKHDIFSTSLFLDGSTGVKWHGHFSKCPEEYKHYCIKGRCRYVAVEQTPACVCEIGYTGARCERLDLFYLRGDEGQIMVVSVIAVMVLATILTVCTCTCTHYCRKRCQRKKEEMRTLNKEFPIKIEDTVQTDIVFP
uniref:Probetacellulin n=1 Tax=Varanus komodoensis TaxID=61221 RepID=A0A8D2J1K8_VARKO